MCACEMLGFGFPKSEILANQYPFRGTAEGFWGHRLKTMSILLF